MAWLPFKHNAEKKDLNFWWTKLYPIKLDLDICHVMHRYMNPPKCVAALKNKYRHPPFFPILFFLWAVFFSHDTPLLTTSTTQYYSTNTATSCANIWVCCQIPNHTDQSPRYYRSTKDLWTSPLIWRFSRHIPSPRIYQIKAFLISSKYSLHPLSGWHGRLVS